MIDIHVVFQIAAVGILVAILNQVLNSVGRQEQATMTSLAGVIIVLFWIVKHISELFDTVQILFKL